LVLIFLETKYFFRPELFDMIDSGLYVDNIIAWLQNKVAENDLQIWEKSVVRRELQEELTVEGSRKAPVPEHLIDLDLVQGSTFPKAKPIEGGWRPWVQVQYGNFSHHKANLRFI